VKKVIIFGGTGTLGTALIKRIYPVAEEITVFSRDELKQKILSSEYPTINYRIGDIQNYDLVFEAMRGCDTVFHFAAMKHIDIVEKNILPGLHTNIDGSINIARAAIKSKKVRKVFFSSTDKAVRPINAYGCMKSIIERHYLNLNEIQNKVKFHVFRWGNVFGSRGSVIHTFKDSLLKNKTINITDHEMTRFWIHIEDAVSFMLDPNNQKTDSVAFPNMKAASLVAVSEALAAYLGIEEYGVNAIGKRPGEKIHEDIYSGEDGVISSDIVERFTHDEIRQLIARVLRR